MLFSYEVTARERPNPFTDSDCACLRTLAEAAPAPLELRDELRAAGGGRRHSDLVAASFRVRRQLPPAASRQARAPSKARVDLLTNAGGHQDSRASLLHVGERINVHASEWRDSRAVALVPLSHAGEGHRAAVRRENAEKFHNAPYPIRV